MWVWLIGLSCFSFYFPMEDLPASGPEHTSIQSLPLGFIYSLTPVTFLQITPYVNKAPWIYQAFPTHSHPIWQQLTGKAYATWPIPLDPPPTRLCFLVLTFLLTPVSHFLLLVGDPLTFHLTAQVHGQTEILQLFLPSWFLLLAFLFLLMVLLFF